MENEINKKFETFKHETAAAADSITAKAQNLMDQGTEAYGKAEQAVSEAYDKTTEKVKETYEKAKNYSGENPGKTILIALGVGVGVGMLLSASSCNRSRTGRIAQPIINALSEIAHEFFG